MDTPAPVLITIPISHFCERARWALEYSGIEFHEKPRLQMFHRIALKRIGAGRTTPALRVGKTVLPDSNAILSWASDRHRSPKPNLVNWAPNSPESRTMLNWGEDIAQWSRLVAYAWLLPNPTLLLRYNNRGAPAWQGLLLRIGYAKAQSMVRQHFNITESTIQAAHDSLRRFFDRFDELLGSSNYIRVNGGVHNGERFSALDLTLASYLAPLCLPHEYGIAPGSLPPVDECPEDLTKEILVFRTHPLGQYVLRMFKDHRRGVL